MPRKTIPTAAPQMELVQKRAYDVFLSRGGAHGADFDDWLEAERQLREEGLLNGPKARSKTKKQENSKTPA